MVRDDKNRGTMWSVERNELFHHIAGALEESEEWNKFNDELGEKMRGVGLIFEKYCKFTPDVGEGVHLLDD